jgi:hypothetical protein
LTEGLTGAHYNAVAEHVFNRAETNASERGEWLEKADNEGWTAAETRRKIVAGCRAHRIAAPARQAATGLDFGPSPRGELRVGSPPQIRLAAGLRRTGRVA